MRTGFVESREERAAKTLEAGAPLRGEALAALFGSELRERFYSWRGGSGRRYVCSVFPAAEQAVVGERWAAAVIGVANECGARRAVYVMTSGEFGALAEKDAKAQGVNEWHVHFGMDEAGLRDLAGSLLS